MDRRSFLGGSVSFALLGVTGCLTDAGLATTATTESTTTTTTTTSEATTSEGTTTAPTTTSSEPTTTADGETTTAKTTTTTTTTTATTTQGPAPSRVEVKVGKDGLFFAPETFRLAKGGTVEWVWIGNGHNLIPGDVPSGSDWSGTPGGKSRTYDSGYTHTHTFDVAGEYQYYCSVHRKYGLTGSFTVE